MALLDNMLAILMKDGYKSFHPYAYRPGYKVVTSNYTNRSGKHSNTKTPYIVNFGDQLTMMEIHSLFDTQFFNLSKDYIKEEYKRIMNPYLMKEVKTEIFEKLHDLGYLPIEVRALSEGACVPYQVPVFTIRNTHPDFGWLPNMLETLISSYKWPLTTSATTAFAYLTQQKQAMLKAGMSLDLLPFMCHDFSARGMFGPEAGALSGIAHLTSFAGTDTIASMLVAEKYYGAKIGQELVGASVDATEHSCTCSWIEVGEKEFVEYLMDEASPEGILSIVSDTWDFWHFVTKIIPSLKDKIMARNGKIVLRPDSGDPVEILCGKKITTFEYYLQNGDVVWVDTLKGYVETKYLEMDEYGDWFCDNNAPIVPIHEVKGLIETLWDEFGGTLTDQGYKLLDDHIGAIYGDSITLERQKQINERLMTKGFAPQAVLGIGSYSYQYVTRDTHGGAIKATKVGFEDRNIDIFKDPKTDTSKRSAKGLIKVVKENGIYKAYDEQSEEDFASEENCLKVIYKDGNFIKTTTLSQIRELVNSQA